MAIAAGALDQRITFQRRSEGSDPVYGTPSQTWTDVCTVWAEVQDMLPSRGERVAEGVRIANRPARVRIRYRADISSDMRIVHRGRVLQIVGGPAELGRREGLELVAEEYSTSGAGQ